MSWRNQKLFALLALIAVLYLQASAWDDRDLANLRAEAEAAKADGVRYLVEQSGYRPVAYASAFHCRAPVKGERLTMQHANPREPGKGYRCTYWLTTHPAEQVATVTWSRSPDLQPTTPRKAP